MFIYSKYYYRGVGEAHVINIRNCTFTSYGQNTFFHVFRHCWLERLINTCNYCGDRFHIDIAYEPQTIISCP